MSEAENRAKRQRQVREAQARFRAKKRAEQQWDYFVTDQHGRIQSSDDFPERFSVDPSRVGTYCQADDAIDVLRVMFPSCLVTGWERHITYEEGSKIVVHTMHGEGNNPSVFHSRCLIQRPAVKDMPDTGTKFVAVTQNEQDGQWSAVLQYNNRNYHLGWFPTEHKAVTAFDNKANELREGGTRARLALERQQTTSLQELLRRRNRMLDDLFAAGNLRGLKDLEELHEAITKKLKDDVYDVLLSEFDPATKLHDDRVRRGWTQRSGGATVTQRARLTQLPTTAPGSELLAAARAEEPDAMAIESQAPGQLDRPRLTSDPPVTT